MAQHNTIEEKIKALEANPVASVVMMAMDKTPEQVLSKSRHAEYVECRRVIAYFLYTLRYWGPVSIGELLDNDHGNINKTIKKAQFYMTNDKRFKGMIDSIKPLIMDKLKQ